MPVRLRRTRWIAAAALVALPAFAYGLPCSAAPNGGSNSGQSAAGAVQFFIDLLTQPAGAAHAPPTRQAPSHHAAPRAQARPAARRPTVDTAVREVPVHGGVAQWRPQPSLPAGPKLVQSAPPSRPNLFAPRPAQAPAREPQRGSIHTPSLAQLNAHAEADAASRMAVDLLRTSAVNVSGADAHVASYGRLVDVDAVVHTGQRTLHRKMVLQRMPTGFRVVYIDPKLHSDALRRKAGIPGARPAATPSPAATIDPGPSPTPSPTAMPRRRPHALFHHH